MIENAIINQVAPVVGKLPYIDLSGIFDQPGVQFVINILSVVSYFFPWDSVLIIVGIMCSLQTIRLVIAFLKTLMSIVPFV